MVPKNYMSATSYLLYNLVQIPPPLFLQLFLLEHRNPNLFFAQQLVSAVFIDQLKWG